MFTIKCDNKYIYNPRSKKYLVENTQLTQELNKAGTLTFNIPPTNPLINKISGLTSEIKLFNDKELEFLGRVIDTKDNFYNQKNITVEGELAFLCDSIQRLKVYKCTPFDFFKQLIEEHNKQVSESKQFKVGMFTLKDANDFIYRYTNYENTLSVLNDKLISGLGGYLRIRHINGSRYLDLVESYENTNSQVIEFKKNLLDFSKYIKLSDIRTAMIPLGCETDETVETDGENGTIKKRLTILDYPDGEYGDIVKNGDIIYSKTGVEKYGFIYADKNDSTWNDVTVPENLFKKACGALTKLINVTLTIELNAIDLNLINVDIEKIKLGDRIRVVSKPHNLDSYFLVTKLVKNLQKPENNKITLGDSLGCFTDSINRATNSNSTTIEDIKHTTTNEVEDAKKTATDLLKSVTEGDVQFIDGNLYILDNPDPKKAKKVCRWNKEGWGYSRTGIDGEYVMAATLDSGIVADMITTGILNSIEIRNGENFRVDAEGNVQIKANAADKYIYTDLDIYLALLHIQGKYILPKALVNLYKCASTGDDINIIDVTKMYKIKDGEIEPTNSISAAISIDANNINETIALKIDNSLKTIVGLFQIYSYMIKSNNILVGDGYSTNLNEDFYGIQLNGQKKTIRVTDTTNSVGTEVNASKVDTYDVYAGNGNAKGKCMHSPDFDFGGNNHNYLCHYTGSALVFNIDPAKGADFNVGPFWINSGSSDRRLKHSIKKINKNLLNFINEIEIKQFIFNDDHTNKIRFGVIAQDVIRISKKYNIDIWNYDLVIKGITYQDKKGKKYYAINYTQFLLLKLKYLEYKLKNFEKKGKI